MTALARPAAIVNVRPILSSERGCYIIAQVFSWKIKILVVGLTVLVFKTK
jgi:hypothetical protein